MYLPLKQSRIRSEAGSEPARSEYIVSQLRRRIGFLGHVYCFPGEDEMGALALNALAVLRGKRQAKVYI